MVSPRGDAGDAELKKAYIGTMVGVWLCAIDPSVRKGITTCVESSKKRKIGMMNGARRITNGTTTNPV